jgi:multicomponent Na+:H+ antiporter subunit E
MRIIRDVTRFALLLGFWLLLSGHYDPLFVGMGVASALLVTLLSRPLLDTLGAARDGLPVHPVRLVLYLGWLLGRMAVSALQVAWIITHPRQQPHPGVVRFACELSSPLARTVLANSITLVPGTMTLDVRDREFVVHAFTPAAAEDLATGALQSRIAAVFRDDRQAAPRMRWEHEPRPADEEERT